MTQVNVLGDTPFVSVIIPTHNCGTYIAQAIESVLTQTFTEYEIIVVNDGSTDHTETALAPYVDKIQYLYQKNRGVSAARNAGIARARGEFVAFLDADDVWLPTKLELQVQAFKSYPECGVVFNVFMDFDDTGVTRSSRLNTRPEAMAWFDRHRVDDSETSCGQMYEQLMAANWIHASSAIVRRDVLSEVGLFDESLRSGEDLELWLRVARQYPFLCVNQVLSGYRYRPDSLCGPTDSRAMRINRIVVKVLEQHLRNRQIPRGYANSVRGVISQRYWSLGWNSFGENRFAESRRFLRRGLRYQPLDKLLWLYLLSSYFPLPIIELIRRVLRWSRTFQGRAETVQQ